MDSAVTPVKAFQTEALNVIFQEVAQAAQHPEGYDGVSFDSGTQGIRILYYHQGFWMGQPQCYPNHLWKNICLAMRLIGHMAHTQDWPQPIQLREYPGWNHLSWHIYHSKLGASPLPTLEVLLRRIDQVIQDLDAPITVPSPATLIPVPEPLSLT